MLGKRNGRAHAFSICHAAVLAAFIMVAQLMGMASDDGGVRLSGQDVLELPTDLTRQACSHAWDGLDRTMSCAAILKTKQDGSGVVLWQFGVRL